MKNFIEVTEGLLAELKRQTEIAELYREKCAYMEKTVAALKKNIAVLKAIKEELEKGAAAVTAVATVKNETAEKAESATPVLVVKHVTFNGKDLRILIKDGVIWWSVKDVGAALDLQNISQNLFKLPSDEKGIYNTHTPGGVQKMQYVNEMGLYRLIFTSRKPDAEEFRRWVMLEVLPKIKAVGGYQTATPLKTAKEKDFTVDATFDGKKLRILVNGEVTWWVGKDVADILGYTNSRKALADHVDEEDKGVTKCYTLGGVQELTVINESGLYSLILSSKLPTAKKFKRWVTSEVLPSIRKYGCYSSVEI